MADVDTISYDADAVPTCSYFDGQIRTMHAHRHTRTTTTYTHDSLSIQDTQPPTITLHRARWARLRRLVGPCPRPRHLRHPVVYVKLYERRRPGRRSAARWYCSETLTLIARITRITLTIHITWATSTVRGIRSGSIIILVITPNTLSLSLALSCSLSLALSHAHSLPPSHTHAHTLPHSHAWSLMNLRTLYRPPYGPFMDHLLMIV